VNADKAQSANDDIFAISGKGSRNNTSGRPSANTSNNNEGASVAMDIA
jgi:hypothetical protein